MKSKKEILTELITLFVLLCIVCCVCLCACKPTYEYTNTVQTETMIDYEYVYNRHQLDSALYTDNLPNDFMNEWIQSSYIDYETNNPIIQYFYYKLNKNNQVSDIYKISFDTIKLYNSIDTLFNYSRTHVNIKL